VFCDKNSAMKKEKIIDRSGFALSRRHVSLDGAASRELQTRADCRRKYLIPRLSAHFLKKSKPPIQSEI
jgi:hypothetical protein